MNYPITHHDSLSVVRQYIETSQQRKMDWKPQKIVFCAAVVSSTSMSPDSPRQQLTMTGVVGAEAIEDGLVASRRPPSKHSTSLARVT